MHVCVQDIGMDVTTAGSIAQSLRALREGCTDQAVMEVVTLMATKPMKVKAPGLFDTHPAPALCVDKEEEGF